MRPKLHNHPRTTGVQGLLFVSLALNICPSQYAGAQSITQDVVIDNNFPAGEPLEKVIEFFTSLTFPSVAVGNGRGGMYLYQSTSGTPAGPWRRSTIAKGGAAFEQARAITFPGQSHPGIVASIGNQIVWFENPWNNGSAASVTQPWRVHVINPNHGCHDLLLEDLDGDSRIDVICSSAISLRAPEFVAFQNDPQHWQVVYNVAGAGDGVAVVRIGANATPNLVGTDSSGNISWYENPRLHGGNARTSNWIKHYIGPGNVGNSLVGGKFSSTTEAVITAANEHEGPGGTTDTRGITLYEQPADPRTPWIAHGVGPDYRDMHAITLGQWNGVPYFLVAEEEQACKPARPEGNPPTHPGIPCRITIFQWKNGALRATVLANTSTHNQAVLPWGAGLMMTDANHGVFGASRAIHLRVIMP
ncbi:MAG: repeat protein [Gammaproteobacteria bacterium]|nr:repeat protein [Gammaproteobacteria bacterium]